MFFVAEIDTVPETLESDEYFDMIYEETAASFKAALREWATNDADLIYRNHVINIFREAYGITPFEYLNDVKLRRAMYLLEVTSKSIDEIARESGFNHYSHFFRLFMRKNGISPYEWRHRVRTTLK